MHRITRSAALTAAALATAGLAAACGGSSGGGAPTRSSASAAVPTRVMISIDHVQRGCHSWSLPGRSLSPTMTVRIASGGSLQVMNDDVMPHRLVQVSGPRAAIARAGMSSMGAMSRVSFPTAGRYRFTTRPGEDYVKGITTVGPDHVLRLTVVVA